MSGYLGWQAIDSAFLKLLFGKNFGQVKLSTLKVSGCFLLILVSLLLLSPCWLRAASGPRLPGWLSKLSEQPMPEFPPETEAVYLLYSQTLKCTSNGLLIRSGRQAIKILRSEGIEQARFLVKANTFQVRVRKMNGWVVNPDGSWHGLDIKSAVSTSMAPDTLYWDVKTLILALPYVVKGSLVGFEWEEEIKPISLEDRFYFQNRYPVLKAQYTLNFPSGFQPLLTWINWPETRVSATERSITVELENIPSLKDEPLRPVDEAVAGWLLIRLKPTGREKYGRFFSDWKDVGLWYEDLSRERRIPDEKIKAKALELTSGQKDPGRQIETLADFVQREIRYVSIQIGLGGYQPHPAPEILANRYGDCKDKATLLAALLQSLGFDSYYLIVNTEHQVVTWSIPATLYCFNHVVLAIKLPDEKLFEGAEAVISEPQLGRLLIFDPTMTNTPIGRLPFYLQKNFGLLVAGEASRLLEFPQTTPEKHQLIRQGRFILSADGSLKGQVSETLSGYQADVLRLKLREAPENAQRKEMEDFLAKSLGTFNLEKYEYLNLDQPSEDIKINYTFTARNYLSRTGETAIFKPGILKLFDDYEVFKQVGPRKYPVLLASPGCGRDYFEISLPEGYTIEVLPEPVVFSNGFADYSCQFELKGRSLYVNRQIRIKEDSLPASLYEDVLQFFRTLAAEEQRRLLLKKLNGEAK